MPVSEGRYRHFNPLEKLPADWPNAVASFVAPLSNLNLAPKSAAVVMAPLSSQPQLSLGVDGLWRYVEAEVDAAVPAGAAQTYDIVATTTANVFHSPTHEGEGEGDETDYAFALQVVTAGTLPSGGGIAAAQKVGEVDWDGAKIIGIRQQVGTLRSTDPLSPTQPLTSVPALTGVGIAGATAAVAKLSSPEGTKTLLELIQGAAAKVKFLANGTIQWVGGPALEASGTELIVSGKLQVTEAAQLVAGGTSTTPAVNDNTTKIATTAYVIGQHATANPLMDGAAAVGASNLWARQDHVHPTDTSRAPEAGSAAIVTVGHIGAGVWEGTPIATAFIANLAVTEGKLANGAVTAAKLAAEAVETAALHANAVTEAKLGAEAVNSGQIKNLAVTEGKLAAALLGPAAGAFGLRKLGTGATEAAAGNDARLEGVSPIGTVADWAGAADPNAEWLICNGREISRATYATLFAVIGTTYGAGNGTTTFNIPNAEGRVTLGKSGAHALASTGGAETVTLTAAQSGLPVHQHRLGSISQQVPVIQGGALENIGNTGGNAASRIENTQNSAAGVNAEQAHTNMQPYLTLNKIIRVL